jgi:hypothetical protein
MGIGDRKIVGLQARPKKKKSQQDPISKNKPGMVVYICNVSYVEGRGRRIKVQRWSKGKKHETLSKK